MAITRDVLVYDIETDSLDVKTAKIKFFGAYSYINDEYYLLGDNRPSSLDSRFFGPLKRNYIIGKTLWRGWPLDKIGFLFNKIEYNL